MEAEWSCSSSASWNDVGLNHYITLILVICITSSN